MLGNAESVVGDHQQAVAAHRPARFGAALAAVFVLALVVRAAIVAHSRGGPFGDFGYDSSVYYSAADALIHGRLPYADFTLLHPPALPLVLTPFALLGRLTSDHTGFVVANCAFEVLGAVNAVLVVLVGRRAGLGRFAATAGGVFYALWPGAAGAEISARLEPLGNALLLCALLVALRAAARGWGRGSLVACGALLGAAAVTKIWWIVPLLVIAAWTTWREGRRGLLLIGGAAASMIVIAGPFFVNAPSTMWRMIVLDQLGRPSTGSGVVTRLGKLTSLGTLLPHPPVIVVGLALVPVLALVVLAGVRAWRQVDLRPIVLAFVAQLLVLVASPTYFAFYADYLAPAAALLLAGALAARPGGPARPADRSSGRLDERFGGRLGRDLGGRHVVGVLVLALVAVATVAEVVVDAPAVITPFPGAFLARAASRAHLRCVMSDTPMALIELDVLSSDFEHGCANRVDVSGSTYDLDRPADGRDVPRLKNQRWQRDVYRYLLSGDAEIVIRHATGLSRATERRLDRLPVIAERHQKVLRRTP